MEGGKGGVRGMKKERKENGKIKEKSLSGCIHACKHWIVYQALFCPVNKHTSSYHRAEKLQIFNLTIFALRNQSKIIQTAFIFGAKYHSWVFFPYIFLYYFDH